jgi:hypothetical protein
MKDRTTVQVSQQTHNKIKALSGLMGQTIDSTINYLASNELGVRGINPETMRALHDQSKN